MKTIKTLGFVAFQVYMHKLGHDAAHETGYYTPHIEWEDVIHAAKALWFAIWR